MNSLHNSKLTVYTEDKAKLVALLYLYVKGELYMEVERKVRKIGNSLGVYLPADMLKEAGVKEGDTVFVSTEDGDIVIRSGKQKKEHDSFKEKVLAIIAEYMEESK